jgi:hypothetical protein
MIYKCLRCEYEEARGCLPTVTCGIFLMLQMLVASYGLVLLIRLRPPPEPQPAPDLGWWGLLVYPLLIAITVFLMLVSTAILIFLLEFIEYLIFALRKCPKCGARRWSWGYTRGFGL